MNTYAKASATQDVREKISTLWVVVTLNIVFADIVGFLNPGTLEAMMKGAVGFEITQGLLLLFAVLLEIPIIMIFLSRILQGQASRWANIVAGAITILYVVGAGSLTLSYIFFAVVEVIGMLLIMWYAWAVPHSAAQRATAR